MPMYNKDVGSQRPPMPRMPLPKASLTIHATRDQTLRYHRSALGQMVRQVGWKRAICRSLVKFDHISVTVAADCRGRHDVFVEASVVAEAEEPLQSAGPWYGDPVADVQASPRHMKVWQEEQHC